MARKTIPLQLTEDQRSELLLWERKPTTPQRLVRRCQIILHRANGLSQEESGKRVGMSRPTVIQWEKRFRCEGFSGLQEAKRSGRKPSISPQLRAEILHEATRPPKGRQRWSTRTMAKAKGVSNQTVHKIWQANDIKPHLTRTFKVSNDRRFEEKFWDVIGLYLNPPEKALVLCCDEKSQCQALERTQPGLPLGVGHVRTATHDYTRHGTVTLFAALNYLDGKILHNTAPRHTHKEWLAFLKMIDTETPDGLSLHLIIDNYCTHKHKKVGSWIERRNRAEQKKHGQDRIVLHFTPTSSSWMNLVERFFRDITQDCIREGSFGSIQELVKAITDYLAERNLEPKAYKWKADGKQILEKIQRAREAMAKNNV